MAQYNNALIKENYYYTLEVNLQKNRAYLTLKGFWDNCSDLSNYLSDVQAGLQMLSADFTLLVDLTHYTGTSPEMHYLHAEAYKLAVKVGISKTAEVFPSNPLVKMFFESFSKEVGLNSLSFRDKEHAERWLDLY